MSKLSVSVKKARKQPDYALRRNLSGIFIPDILPHDKGESHPTCIEDCTQVTRLAWLRSQSLDRLKQYAEDLSATLQKVFDLMKPEEIGEHPVANPVDPGTDSKESWVTAIDDYAVLLHQFAWAAGVSNQGSEGYQYAVNRQKS